SSKALRVPGCVSVKHDRPFLVRGMWEDAQYYQLKPLWKKVKHVIVPVDSVMATDLKVPDMTSEAVLSKYKVRNRVKQLIAARNATGDRSGTLWHLECMLSEAGIPPEEVLVVVRDTVCNKFKGQQRELPQLWGECQKAAAQVRRNGSKSPKQKSKPKKRVNGTDPKLGIRMEQYSAFMARTIRPPSWLVKGFWSENAHGLIAGE